MPSTVEKEIKKIKLIDSNDTILAKEPFVTFSEEKEGNYLYCIRILAFIPTTVTEFNVIGPSDKEKIKTDIGEVVSRTIKIKWGENIAPETAPQDLWSITIRYFPIEFNSKDNIIKVVYEYGDPKTTRGTITTSGNPS